MKEIETQQKTHEKAKLLKVIVVKSLRDYNKNCTYRVIKCSKCDSEYPIQDQTFSRWAKAGKKYCGYCNGSQKALSLELKVRQLNDKLQGTPYEDLVEVTEYLGYATDKQQAYCSVKFTKCNHTKKYSTTTLGHMLREGKMFKCDTCESSNISAIEEAVGERLPSNYLPQVPYSAITTCDRKWISDYYSFIDNTIIEVSTGHTKVRQDYSGNIKEKEQWCVDNNIRFVFLSSLNDLEDIVQSLGKPRGANT